MESKNYKTVSLPIENDVITPGKPDFQWLGWTIGAIVGLFFLAYISFTAFSYVVIANINEQQEHKIFGEMMLQNMDYEPLSLTGYSIKIPEFNNYDFFLIDSDEFDQANAFSYLGGGIGVTQALLDQVSNEEELFFILAHEVGHTKKRHNLKRLSRDIPMFMTLSFIGLDFDLGIASSNSLLSNAYSRGAEHESDDYAIELFKKYGLNTQCATPFFEEALGIPKLLSTHPTNKERIQKMKDAGSNKKECRTIER